jgi:hypothetical protein
MGCAILLTALLLGRVLAVTGPLLVALGFAGIVHGLLFPTRWIEIVARDSEPVPPFQIHGVRRKGARRILAIVRGAMTAEDVSTLSGGSS